MLPFLTQSTFPQSHTDGLEEAGWNFVCDLYGLIFFNKGNICSIEANFLERYCLASTAAFFNSHKKRHLFRYFPATLEGRSVLVSCVGERTGSVKDTYLILRSCVR